MSHPRLVILGYSEAAMFLRGSPSGAVAGIVSIHGARDFGVEGEVSHRLDLTFDDVDVPEAADVMATLRAASRKRWTQANGLVEVAPTSEDAAAIVRFAEAVRHVEGIVMCHCGAGMSRAPAAGLICLATWRGAGAEVECVAEIRALRRGAAPHLGLIRLADELLGRGRRLVNAVLAVE